MNLSIFNNIGLKNIILPLNKRILYQFYNMAVLNHISFEDCLPGLDGDNRVGTVGLKGRGLLNRGISSKVIVPLNREDRSGHIIGPNVGGGGAPERNGVGGDGPVGWVPSFNFLARHSVWGCLVSKKRKNLDTLMPKFKTLQKVKQMWINDEWRSLFVLGCVIKELVRILQPCVPAQSWLAYCRDFYKHRCSADF